MSEINNINNSPANIGVNQNVGDANKNDTAAKAVDSSVSASQIDKVSLSGTLSKLEKAIAEVPEVDKNRVAAIKEAIENGSYQVNTKELAQKMIDFEGGF